jgi:hypothetical protein
MQTINMDSIDLKIRISQSGVVSVQVDVWKNTNPTITDPVEIQYIGGFNLPLDSLMDVSLDMARKGQEMEAIQELRFEDSGEVLHYFPRQPKIYVDRAIIYRF